MIDVQKCPLRTFKKNLFAGPHRLMNRQDGIGDQWPNFFPDLQVLAQKRLELYRTSGRDLAADEFASFTRAFSFSVNNSGCKRSPTRIPTLAILSP